VNLPVTALTGAAVLLGVRGRTVAAGGLLGFAAALKVLPAALILWFLVRRDWKAVGAFVCVAVGSLVVIPTLVGGPVWMWEANRGWLDLLFSALTKGSEGLQSGGGYVGHLKNGSIVAVMDRMFGGGGQPPILTRLPQETITRIALLLRVIVIAGSVATVIRLWRPRHPVVEPYAWPLVASLLLLAGWLVNLLLWDHHTIGLALILPIVACACLDGRLPDAFRSALWFGLVAAVMGLTSGFFPGSRKLGLQSLCFALLWGSIAWALVTSPPPEPPRPRAAEQLELPFPRLPA
jgi:alpha-1,2-mannosyltransferase